MSEGSGSSFLNGERRAWDQDSESRPTSRVWKCHVAVSVAASFLDQQLEEQVTIFGWVRGPFDGNSAQLRIVQQVGMAADEELPTCPKCVWDAVVECIPPVPRSRRSRASGEVGSMKTKSRPPPTIEATGWTLGVPLSRRVAK